MDFLPVSLRLPGLVEWVLRYTPKATRVQDRIVPKSAAWACQPKLPAACG